MNMSVPEPGTQNDGGGGLGEKCLLCVRIGEGMQPWAILLPVTG